MQNKVQHPTTVEPTTLRLQNMLSTAELQLLSILKTICFVESLNNFIMKSFKYNLGWAVVVV